MATLTSFDKFIATWWNMPRYGKPSAAVLAALTELKRISDEYKEGEETSSAEIAAFATFNRLQENAMAAWFALATSAEVAEATRLATNEGSVARWYDHFLENILVARGASLFPASS